MIRLASSQPRTFITAHYQATLDQQISLRQALPTDHRALDYVIG